VRISCSFGVAELDSEMRSPTELYAAADHALMTSKRAGRNRVTVYSR
jgi:PleD family two-component response regulator